MERWESPAAYRIGQGQMKDEATIDGLIAFPPGA